MYTKVEDVLKLLPPATITNVSSEYITVLIEEAGDLIDGFCKRSFSSPPPAQVARVAARIVARTLKQENERGGAIPEYTSNVAFTAGEYSRSISFDQSASSGGVWLSKSDKSRLARYRGGVFTVLP